MAKCNYSICEFGMLGLTSKQIADISNLHSALLVHSPLVLMGRKFMEEFYYDVLPEEGLICGAIAYVDSQAVGFIVGSNDANGFMSRAMKKHWPSICWILQ